MKKNQKEKWNVEFCYELWPIGSDAFCFAGAERDERKIVGVLK